MNWMEKKIIIGADHAGFEYKQKITDFLQKKGIPFEDVGTHSVDSCDYPDIAFEVAKKVLENDARGILICGTGIGMSIAANKVKSIRAALCHNDMTATMSRQHNDANILCLGSRILEFGNALLTTKVWLETNYDGQRHQKRLDMISDYENNN